MDQTTHNPNATPAKPPGTEALTTELLILEDGQLLVRNLTPTFAALLEQINQFDDGNPAASVLGGVEGDPVLRQVVTNHD